MASTSESTTVESLQPPKSGRKMRSDAGWQAELRRLAPVIVAIIAVAAFATVRSDTFLTVTNIQNLFQQIAVLGVVTIGTSLLMIGGKIDLAIGSAVSLVSVLGAKIMMEAGAPEIVTILAMIAIATLIGVAIGGAVVSTGVQPFIITLGGLSAFSALAYIVSNSRPVSTGLAFSPLALDNFLGIPLSALVFILLAIGMAMLLRFTGFGRRVYALGSNEEAAFLAGVPIKRTTVMLFGINGALIGVASVLLIARVGSGDPQGGVGLEIQAITAAVLGGATLAGGRGSMFGAFLGVLLLGVISNSLQISGVSSNWSVFVYGAVLIVAVTWAALREKALLKPTPIQD